MKGDFSIPPLRDLPPNRLAQRREHLLSEIAQPPSRLRLPRRGSVALVAAALIVVVGTASAIGSVRAFILDQGFIGLPPQGATPSTPETGELVLRWLGRTATPAPLSGGAPCSAPGCTRTAESSGVRPRSGADSRGRERAHLRLPRATTHARERRAPAVGSHRTPRRQSHSTRDRSRPMTSPVGGLSASRYATATGSSALLREAIRRAPPRGCRSSLRLSDGSTRLLTDTASVLPPSAWAVREVRAYVPTHYAVCIEHLAAKG